MSYNNPYLYSSSAYGIPGARADTPAASTNVLGAQSNPTPWLNSSNSSSMANPGRAAVPSSGGSGGTPAPTSTPIWDDNVRNSGGGIDTSGPANAINQGYDAYFGQLDQILNSNLPAQQLAQQGIANTQFEQGKSSLDTQRSLQQQGLEGQKKTVAGQQKKTLGDVANNLRNSFMAGNIYLGARGAGDSSAANQYSYALTKMGSQQRGDVNAQYAGIQNQIMERENALATTYAGQIKDLQFQKDQKINEIASWFNEQQSALRQAQASGQLSKAKDLATISTNLLQMAQQQLATAQSDMMNRRSMLEQWAMNNATNIQGLKQNLTAVGSQVGYTNPQAQPLAGINQQTGSALTYAAPGYGSSTEKEKNIFGV